MQVRCPHCHSTVQSTDADSQTDVSCSACGEAIDLSGEISQIGRAQPGQKLGHFRLLQVVGHGGFGVVWRADDTELDRVVAIKTPRNGMMEAHEVNRFLREAQAAAQLNHPNIVTVYEVGRIDEIPYIVSDFVEGVTLSKWIDGHRPHEREAVEMCATLADALEHAHQSGVVHRDIKPGNILLDRNNSPKITDFGLAKRTASDMTVTFKGEISGTPAYMAPEQARGQTSDVDCRSDIYAMGVILFELVTGEKPFRGDQGVLLNQVLNDEPPSPRRLNQAVSRDLETICLKCLEKKNAKRYQSARELADDLRRLLSNQPILARPAGRIERIGKWAQRRPLIAGLSTAVIAVVLLGLTGVTWQWRRVVASQRRHAMTQVEMILHAQPSAVASAIEGLGEFREWADPELRRRAQSSTAIASEQFRIQLALLEHDPDRATAIVDYMLRDSPTDALEFDELAMGADILDKFGVIPCARLSDLAANTAQTDAARFRALFLLARVTNPPPDSPTIPWDDLAPFASRQLVATAGAAPQDYRILTDSFRSIGRILLRPLGRLLTDQSTDSSTRFTAAPIVGEYAAHDVEFLCDLLLEVGPEQYSVILPYLQPAGEYVGTRCSDLLAQRPGESDDRRTKDHLLSRQAVAAVTLLHLGKHARIVWPLLQQSTDMSLRTLLIHRCAEWGLPPEVLTARLTAEPNATIRRALLLALGEYDFADHASRAELRPHLEKLYRHDPDSGVHSAVAWLLRTWDEDALVRRMDDELSTSGPVVGRQWYVNSQGHTMVVVDRPPIFLMGSPEGEPERTPADRLHYRNVDRRFAISTTEVTYEQFNRFYEDYYGETYKQSEKYGPAAEGPAFNVTWFDALRYCKWLSKQHGIDGDHQCLPPISEIREGIEFEIDFLDQPGYRLPTDGEWECVCRAGTLTPRYFGDADELVAEYGWYLDNSADYTWPCGMLKPNDYGLFDLYGNVWEWCLDRYGNLPPMEQFNESGYLDAPKLDGSQGRILRGGAMNNRVAVLRSAEREKFNGDRSNNTIGFRIVTTLPSSP